MSTCNDKCLALFLSNIDSGDFTVTRIDSPLLSEIAYYPAFCISVRLAPAFVCKCNSYS